MEYWGSAFLVRKRDTCSGHFGIERNKLPPIRTYFETKERKSFHLQPGIKGQGRLSLIIPTMLRDLRITKKPPKQIDSLIARIPKEQWAAGNLLLA
jgi:hypothetical protein